MMPRAPIERIVKRAGVGRISLKALKELQKKLDIISLEIATEAGVLARYAKRKTILKEDIKVVARKV